MTRYPRRGSVVGYGHWARDVLVWTKAPLLLWSELVVVDDLDGQRSVGPNEVKRFGDDPFVMQLTDGATAEVAARADDSTLLPGRYG